MVIRKAVFYSQLLPLEGICSLTVKPCSRLLSCQTLHEVEMPLFLETTNYIPLPQENPNSNPTNLDLGAQYLTGVTQTKWTVVSVNFCIGLSESYLIQRKPL